MSDLIGREASITVSAGVATVANGFVIDFQSSKPLHSVPRFNDRHNRYVAGIGDTTIVIDCWIDSATTPIIPDGAIVDVVVTLAAGRTYTASGTNGGGIIESINVRAQANQGSPAQVVRYVIKITSEGTAGTIPIVAA